MLSPSLGDTILRILTTPKIGHPEESSHFGGIFHVFLMWKEVGNAKFTIERQRKVQTMRRRHDIVL